MIPQWLQRLAQSFPSTYGSHALDEHGRCHTKVPDDAYVGEHRKEEERETT